MTNKFITLVATALLLAGGLASAQEAQPMDAEAALELEGEGEVGELALGVGPAGGVAPRGRTGQQHGSAAIRGPT